MIPIVMMNCRIQAEKPFNFGPMPGSSLRGALYGALHLMYDTHQPADDRHDLETNPVGWLLRLEDEGTSGGKDVPRPLAIRPPLEDKVRDTSFGLTFYGRARATIPTVLSALPLMGQLGIGRNKQAFSVVEVSQVDPLTSNATTLLDASGQVVGEVTDPPSEAAYANLTTALRDDVLAVRFLTSTRIVQRGKLVHQPIFRAWVQRLLERVRTISEVYTDDPVWVPFKDLLAQADEVRIEADHTRWLEGWSGSRRDGRVKPMGGFVGEVRYSGEFADLLPYILLGQGLQVGKNTIKGSGWYDVRYSWR